MKQLIDECKFIISGKFFFLVVIAPLIVATVFGYVYQSNTVSEGPLAVVDLDRTDKSAEVIRKLDASQYVFVKTVVYDEIDPNELLYTEEHLAVVYLPKGLEKNALQGLQSTVGFYVDMALASATGNIRAGVTEVFSTENAMVTYGTLKAVGLNDARVAGAVAPYALSQRLLYNPLNSTLSSMILGFVNMVLFALLTSSAITIISRLREEGKLQEAVQSPLGILSRLIPYAVAGVISLYLALGLLKQVGGMRFEASVAQLWVPMLMYTVAVGLFAMIVGWTAPTVKKASGRLLIIVMPTFLMSGVLMPLPMLPKLLQWFSNCLPLSWYFKFIRGMGLRGGELSYFTEILKDFGLLVVGLVAVVVLLIVIEMVKFKRNTEVSPLGNDTLVKTNSNGDLKS